MIGWLKKNRVPILGLVFVVAISIAIFLLYRNFAELFQRLESLGYLGAFLISLVLNATVLLPAGNFLILSALAIVLSVPLLVGVAGGAGAALGETTGYLAGRSGQALIARKGKTYLLLEQWVHRRGAITILVLSAAPMVFDLVGLAAGALRYPFWKFMLFCWIGRTALYVAISLTAAWGLGFFSEITPLGVCITLAVLALLVFAAVLFIKNRVDNSRTPD